MTKKTNLPAFFELQEALWNDGRLSKNARAVGQYMLLKLNWADHETAPYENCFCSQSAVALKTGLSVATVYRALSELQATGWFISRGQRFRDATVFDLGIHTAVEAVAGWRLGKEEGRECQNLWVPISIGTVVDSHPENSHPENPLVDSHPEKVDSHPEKVDSQGDVLPIPFTKPFTKPKEKRGPTTDVAGATSPLGNHSTRGKTNPTSEGINGPSGPPPPTPPPAQVAAANIKAAYTEDLSEIDGLNGETSIWVRRFVALERGIIPSTEPYRRALAAVVGGTGGPQAAKAAIVKFEEEKAKHGSAGNVLMKFPAKAKAMEAFEGANMDAKGKLAAEPKKPKTESQGLGHGGLYEPLRPTKPAQGGGFRNS